MWLRRLFPLVLMVGLLTVAGCDGDSGSSRSGNSSGTGSASAPEEDRAGGGGKAGGSPVYVGARPGIPVEAIPFGDRPVRPSILETSDDALVIRLRWRDWGAPAAVGRGAARINSCEPTCANGRLTVRAGVVAVLGELHSGVCRGRPARFYARAVVEWPPGLGLPPRQAFKLLPRCVEVS
jgi:hypothetical protein